MYLAYFCVFYNKNSPSLFLILKVFKYLFLIIIKGKLGIYMIENKNSLLVKNDSPPSLFPSIIFF